MRCGLELGYFFYNAQLSHNYHFATLISKSVQICEAFSNEYGASHFVLQNSLYIYISSKPVNYVHQELRHYRTVLHNASIAALRGSKVHLLVATTLVTPISTQTLRARHIIRRECVQQLLR